MKWTATRPALPQVVTADDIQASLRITDAYPEDSFIDDIGDAAIEYAEQALDSSLLTRLVTATFYGPNRGVDLGYSYLRTGEFRLFLPRGPVQSVVSVTDASQSPPSPQSATFTIAVPDAGFASVTINTLARADGATAPAAPSLTLVNGNWTGTFTDTSPPGFYYYDYAARNSAGAVTTGEGTVAGATGTTSGTNWALEREGHADLLRMTATWTPPLTVTYLAGYGITARSVPADIRMAIRTHAATLFEQRASTDERTITAVPHSLEAFYARRRRTVPVG